MSKITLVGNRIAQIFPSLLVDALFVHHWNCQLVICETNNAMADLLVHYGREVLKKSGCEGSITAEKDLATAVDSSDAIVFLDAVQPGSCFQNDRAFLKNLEEIEEPKEGEEAREPVGLVNQARSFAGLEGILHTMRTTEKAMALAKAIKTCKKKPLLVNLSEPLGRITAVFQLLGIPAVGMGQNALTGVDGLHALCHAVNVKPENVKLTIAGIPYFCWVTGMTEKDKDLLPLLKEKTKEKLLGENAANWLNWYDAVPVGDYRYFGEYLPQQPGFEPLSEPELGENVETRKQRILYMNTVCNKGLTTKEGQAAQLLLLTGAVSARPMQYLYAILNGTALYIPALAQRNEGLLPDVDPNAIIEAPCSIINSKRVNDIVRLPGAAAEITADCAKCDLLCAKAALGDTQALRQLTETDPSLFGLDRLYCLDIVYALMAENKSYLPSLS